MATTKQVGNHQFYCYKVVYPKNLVLFLTDMILIMSDPIGKPKLRYLKNF